jgi:transcriptional regulator with XRE-family HTH domain
MVPSVLGCYCCTDFLRVDGMARGNFGERLKRERELREVTLEEITSATRIGARFLEAMENEDWGKLPGGVFNRGFVRSVARYLGLDEEALLSEYDMAHGTQLPPANEHPQDRIPSPPRWLPAAVVLGALVILAALVAGGIYAWRYFAARRNVKQSQVCIMPGFPQSAAHTASRTNASGNEGLENGLRSGENRHFTDREGLKVSSADYGAVLLELNGQTMPALGLPGGFGTMK